MEKETQTTIIDASKLNQSPITDGMTSVKSSFTAVPAPQRLLQNDAAFSRTAKDRALAATYGAHMPIRLAMEREILGQFRRLPGLPSAHVGLDALEGRDEGLELGECYGFFEDWFPETGMRAGKEGEEERDGLHVAMEKRLGLECRQSRP